MESSLSVIKTALGIHITYNHINNAITLFLFKKITMIMYLFCALLLYYNSHSPSHHHLTCFKHFVLASETKPKKSTCSTTIFQIMITANDDFFYYQRVFSVLWCSSHNANKKRHKNRNDKGLMMSWRWGGSRKRDEERENICTYYSRRRMDPLKSRLCYVTLFTTTRVTVNQTTRKHSKKITYYAIIPDS